MASRDQAYAQYTGLAASLHLPINAELDNDFQGWWNNASADSHAYSGASYQQTWDQVWPQAAARLNSRVASTNDRTVDSQSAEGNALYGSGSGNQLNIAGAALSAPGVPLTNHALASVVTTLGATPPTSQTPSVGPVGLAYPDDPVNYSTMEVSPAAGYTTGGVLPSGTYAGVSSPLAAALSGAPGADNTMVYILLAGAAVAAYLLLK